jgi:hypothetical protein
VNNKNRKLARLRKRSTRALWVPLIGRAYGAGLRWSSAVQQYVYRPSMGCARRIERRVLARR